MMSRREFGGVLYEKLSECGLKTETKLTTFCECGKRTIEVASSGLMSRINGILAIAGKKTTGDKHGRAE